MCSVVALLMAEEPPVHPQGLDLQGEQLIAGSTRILPAKVIHRRSLSGMPCER